MRYRFDPFDLDEASGRLLRDGGEVGPGQAANLVGRSDLLAPVERALEGAAGGRGSALFLDGEAGIGKTALALESARRAREGGFAVHLGRCLEEAGTPAYWPWMKVLRDTLYERRPEQLPVAWQTPLAELRSLLAGVETPIAGFQPEDSGRRFRLFDAVVRILLAAARERPRLLVLDDLHRADQSSLLLLEHVLGELASASVVVLGTFRGNEFRASDALPGLLGEARPWVTRLEVAGLSRPEVEILLERAMENRPTPALVQVVLERTAGNPLFVEEIGRALAAEQLEGVAAAERAGRLAPAGVREVIAARVARLSQPTQRALALAAVVGSEFDLDVLARAAKTDPQQVARALDPAVSNGLVAEVRGGASRLRFRHILVREALYANLPASLRAPLHERVGAALEVLRAQDVEAHLDELAHHFLLSLPAGGAARAIEYARRAGERDLSNAAYHEAAERFEVALRAVQQLGPEEASSETALREQVKLRVRLGQALWRAGSPTRARVAFEAAASLAERLADGEILARAALGWAGRTDATQGVNRTAVTYLENALAALPPGDGALRAEVLARLSSELYGDVNWQHGRELADEAVAMAERLGDSALLAYALSAQRYSLIRPDGDPERRLAIGHRLIRLALASDAADVQTLGLLDHVVDYLELGDGPRLDAALRSLGEQTTALRQPFFKWIHSAFVGMRTLLQGRVAEAESLARETLARGKALETPNAAPLYAAQLFLIRREQGRLAELASLFESATRSRPELPVLRAGLATSLCAAGRLDEARSVLAQLVAPDLEDLPFDEHWATCLASLVDPARAVGDEGLARRLYEKLAPLAGRMVVVAHGAGCLGPVSFHLGCLADALGDDAAEAHLEAAASQLRRLGAPLWLAHVEAALARRLWKSGKPGDRERARQLAGAARAVYQKLDVRHRATALGEIVTLA